MLLVRTYSFGKLFALVSDSNSDPIKLTMLEVVSKTQVNQAVHILNESKSCFSRIA